MNNHQPKMLNREAGAGSSPSNNKLGGVAILIIPSSKVLMLLWQTRQGQS